MMRLFKPKLWGLGLCGLVVTSFAMLTQSQSEAVPIADLVVDQETSAPIVKAVRVGLILAAVDHNQSVNHIMQNTVISSSSVNHIMQNTVISSSSVNHIMQNTVISSSSVNHIMSNTVISSSSVQHIMQNTIISSSLGRMSSLLIPRGATLPLPQIQTSLVARART